MNNIHYNYEGQEIKHDISVGCGSVHSITGAVRDCGTGEPLRGVTVKAVTMTGTPIEHTLTDCKGEFTLIYQCDKPIRLIFYKECYQTYYTDIITGKCVKVCLCKEESNEKVVEGKVKFCDGTPARMAKVCLVSKCAKHSYETYTNCTGAFMFPKVCVGLYSMTISGTKIKECEKSVVVDSTQCIVNLGTICVKQQCIKNTLNGCITDCHHKPIAETPIGVFEQGCPCPVAMTETNCKGEYFVGGLDNKDYCVKVYH